MRTKVKEMTDEEYKTVQEAVYTQLAEKDKNLGEENNRMS